MYFQHPVHFVGLISRTKLSGAGKHVGVLLPDGLVAHMTPQGAAIVTFEEFAQGRDVTLEKAAPAAHHYQLHWRAYQSIGRTAPYDTWKRNCEHYATWLMGEAPQSSQVNGAVVLGLIGGLLLLTQ